MNVSRDLQNTLSYIKERLNRTFFEDEYTLAETADLRSLQGFERTRRALGNASARREVALISQPPTRIIPQIPHFETEVQIEIVEDITASTDKAPTHYVNELQEPPAELDPR